MKRYQVTIDETDEFKIDLISIVENPAIEVKALAFAESKKVVLSEEQQILAGPILIPDQVIYRYDKDTNEEYEIVFTDEDIKKIYEKMKKSPKSELFNLEHTKEMVQSAYLRSDWLIEDAVNDKSKYYGFDLPVGTLFIECKVEDKAEWIRLKENKQTGFSIEGVFKMIQLSLSKINNEEQKIKLMENKLKDGTAIMVRPGELAIGNQLFVIDAEGNEIPAPAGEHELATGEILVISEEGRISEIKLPEEVVAEEVVAEEVIVDEVKAEITPEDIAVIWEAILPMVMEVCGKMIAGEDAAEADAMDMATELEAVKAELAAVKLSIETTPSTKSIGVELTARQISAQKEMEAQLSRMKNFARK